MRNSNCENESEPDPGTRKSASGLRKPEIRPHPGQRIRNAKERGEWAELRFMTRATELRFRVAKPWGDSAAYDVATEHCGRFLRVQVKCTIFHRGNSYKCHLDSNGLPYSPKDIDIIAAYVIPTDTWYILPIRATNNQSDVLLTPHARNAKYEKYKEAWHLLKG
jgi:hypothetical protein